VNPNAKVKEYDQTDDDILEDDTEEDDIIEDEDTTNPLHQLRLENLKRQRRLQFKTTVQTSMTAPRVLSEVSKFYKEQRLLETRIANGNEESCRVNIITLCTIRVITRHIDQLTKGFLCDG